VKSVVVVPATVVCVLAVYSLLLVIVIKLDQHDDCKSNIVRLMDNSLFDRQKYYVSLETGFRKGAGTTAQVNTHHHSSFVHKLSILHFIGSHCKTV